MKNKISIKQLIKIIHLGAISCPAGRNGLMYMSCPWRNQSILIHRTPQRRGRLHSSKFCIHIGLEEVSAPKFKIVWTQNGQFKYWFVWDFAIYKLSSFAFRHFLIFIRAGNFSRSFSKQNSCLRPPRSKISWREIFLKRTAPALGHEHIRSVDHPWTTVATDRLHYWTV